MGYADLQVNPKDLVGCRNMVSVPGGKYLQSDGTVSFDHTVSSFKIGQCEITYELWYTVRIWALNNGYYFAHAGREGHDGLEGAEPGSAKYEPVTGISWRDAIVWCNAYSEISGLTPVYTYASAVIRDSRELNAQACDYAVCNWSANGYRLPSEGEWQYAASYHYGSFSPYNYASGADGGWTGNQASDYSNFYNYAWYGNSTAAPAGNTVSTKNVGTTRHSNSLNIADMSGNAAEWCWDWHSNYTTSAKTDDRGSSSGNYRIVRGGSWYNGSSYLQVGHRNYAESASQNNSTGLRIVRTR
jgi:formylglycine-generating enzyme required for sulfatase activity